MSLSVKNLNGDTTFLLTFTPSIAPECSRTKFPGSFTILVDPWLVGHSSVWNTKFQISHHTAVPVVSSLTALTTPDLILISQAKPDHCHKETLCTLPRDSRVTILAIPAAAKLIKSWNHFQNATITTLKEYDPKKASSVYCVELKPYTDNTTAGQLTMSFIQEKLDMTGLHNAIGITYRPPGTSFVGQTGLKVDLPLTPPLSPTRSRRSSTPQSQSSTDRSLNALYGIDSPMSGQMSLTPPPSLSPSFSKTQHEQTISILYTPHGLSYSQVTPYIKNHLTKLNALPLTALFHSVNVEQNPWIMGGVVARGFPGGLEMVQKIGAQHWISAHDEVKDNKGWATIWIKSRSYTPAEAQSLLDTALGQTTTKLTVLESGQEMKAK